MRRTAGGREAYLKASSPDTDDLFGGAVALSPDGNRLAIGAENEASGTTIIDGDQSDNSAPGVGAVYVFERIGTSWSQRAYPKAPNATADDAFGGRVAFGDGALLAVAARNEGSGATGVGGNMFDRSALGAGAVYVFSVDDWRVTYVKPTNTHAAERVGETVVMSLDNAMLAIGASGEYSAASGIDGDQLDRSAPKAGAAYLYW